MARRLRRFLNRTLPTPLLIELVSWRAGWSLLTSRGSERSGSPTPREPGDRPYDALCASSLPFLERLFADAGEFRGWAWRPGKVYNGAFESGDLESYYAMLRTLKPRRVIEVGAGICTWYSRRALARNGQGTLTVIDPNPGYPPPRDVTYLARRVEEVDPALFDALESGDILFIDSSHTAEEARYHVESILPRLKTGVVIHHHDIVYPYPARFGEEEVVWRFYQEHQADFEILASLSYVRAEHPEALSRLIPSFRRLPGRVPGSLWARRKAGRP